MRASLLAHGAISVMLLVSASMTMVSTVLLIPYTIQRIFL